MKHLFDKLYKGTPEEKSQAFIQVEPILPDLRKLEHNIKSDFVALGRNVSRFDQWDEETRKRFISRVSSVQTHAKLAGLIIDEDGYRVR